MAQPPADERRIAIALEAFDRLGSKEQAARETGIPRTTVSRYVRDRQTAPLKLSRAFDIPSLPDDDVPTEQLVAHRKKQLAHKRQYEEAVRLIPVTVNLEGPIGIIHLGDPHLDDDGTDLDLFERHVQLALTTEGMFLANVGDTLNNWVGRLARLYAEQSTSAKQGWRIAEYYVKMMAPKLLYMLGGNHDLWSGAGDPLIWMTRQAGVLYKGSGARLGLRFPNGAQIRINARHDFKGHSQWNLAHAQMKSPKFGHRDHLTVSGHRHVSGYGVQKDPSSGLVMHGLQVASYKLYDRYADESGFLDQSLGPCAVTILDPALPDTHPDQVKVYWDPEEATHVLRHKRSRA